MRGAIDRISLKVEIDRNPSSRTKVDKKCAPLFILLVKSECIICFQMRHKRLCAIREKLTTVLSSIGRELSPRIMQLDYQEGRVTVSIGSANGGGYDCSNTMLYTHFPNLSQSLQN